MLREVLPHWLYVIVDWPMNTGPNGAYNFFSGIGALGVVGTFWHRHNCHQPGCWRVVRHGQTHCPRHSS